MLVHVAMTLFQVHACSFRVGVLLIRRKRNCSPVMLAHARYAVCDDSTFFKSLFTIVILDGSPIRKERTSRYIDRPIGEEPVSHVDSKALQLLPVRIVHVVGDVRLRLWILRLNLHSCWPLLAQMSGSPHVVVNGARPTSRLTRNHIGRVSIHQPIRIHAELAALVSMDPLQQLLIILQPLLPLLPGLNVLGQARLVVLNARSQCP
mmetsp:Transcript_10390/g.34662  ORF Transcript_10390/g.34662 Transcript_10390/m.34662 type:complete len:206 (+) Transcript_10390:414-1031(+)